MKGCTLGSCKCGHHSVLCYVILFNLGSYVLGHEAMRKMGVSNVLIAGLKGLGVEVGKWEYYVIQ